MATVRDKSRYGSTSEDGRLHRRALWLCAGDSLCCDGLARFADGTRRARGYRAAGRFTVTPFSAWSAGARDTGSGPSRCRWWSPLELRGGIYVLRWEGPGVARRYVKEPGKRGSPKTAPWFACSSETGGGISASRVPHGPAGKELLTRNSRLARLPATYRFIVCQQRIPTNSSKSCAGWWYGCPASG